MGIGLKIKELRTKKNLSVKDLAESISVTRELIYAYEKEKATPPIEKLELIAKAFDVDMDYFLANNQKDEFVKNLRDELYRFQGVIIGKFGEKTWKELEPYFPKSEVYSYSL